MNIYEHFENDKEILIVGELYSGGELLDKIVQMKHFTEHDAAHVMRQVLSAVNYCHKKGIVHRYSKSIYIDFKLIFLAFSRDLKPQNILYETKEPDATLKIVDFGVSAVIEPNKTLKKATGTVK